MLLTESSTDPNFFRTRSILTSRNSSVKEINHVLIDRLPRETTEYLLEDKAGQPEDNSADLPPVEVLNSLKINGLPSSRLRLKVGTPIMLLRNINPDVGLCNGTRLVVTRLGQNCIEARVIAGKASGEIHFIPRIKLSSDEKDLGFILTRRQFPVQICFAMTINKSQGQSFDVLGVDLRWPVFSHGQFYVGMSRTTDVHNLTVLSPPETDGKVLNIEYPEVLISR